ncbi:MAG TPA: hypothetical protein VG713_10435, partial [Pirellulales bacterium]|nr:hypothetical protein [Pirellulales bacterium]
MAKITPIIRDDALSIVTRVGEPLEALCGSTLLITGSAGFLCSALLDALAAFNAQARRPCRVIAVDNLLVGSSERTAHLLDDPNFRFVQHDVTKPLRLDERVDRIIHGASVA